MMFARVAIGAGFLSAVGDRFGMWGPPGGRNVAWGDFTHFLAYAAKLNPLLPASLVPPVGWVATLCEVVFGVALIAGIAVPAVSLLSGLLLLAFATGMTMGTGVKTALDASVFAAAAAAFLLAAISERRGRR